MVLTVTFSQEFFTWKNTANVVNEILCGKGYVLQFIHPIQGSMRDVQQAVLYSGAAMMTDAKNVLGETLQLCCTSPMTGYLRNGICETGPRDVGTHVVCAEVTEDFLTFTKSRGNDLSTPLSSSNFPGLKPGNKWCLCVSRWKEALDAGVAPPIDLSATHEATLKVVPLEVLQEHALNP